MDSLRKLEDLQTTMMLMQSDGILTTSSDHDSDRFIANLVLFLMQPCGELDLEKKSALVSEYLPKISSGFLEKASVCLTQKKGFQQQILEKDSKFGSEDKSCSEPLTTNYEEMATIGLDAMQRANSTVEDFISVEDVIKAIHLKSFDYRVLNLLLYQLRGEQVAELHMDFLSISEFLVEVADDLFDYEDDVLENNFNVLRMFVRVYGASAPTMLAKYITEAEEKYNLLLKSLDPQLSLNYQKRCEEATREGGNKSIHPLGTWSIPPLIADENLYRSNLLDPK
ncbi:hypothetical protein TIFTF001_004371 [Ficus carica]|uniref:Uncharacterized protein n=1 Tax=Ficus carica TaxID=3494 RepID=A0AA88DCS7_FICCA|nr:hypothetical protein TIFTF001_004371 [Ficus carica]